MQYTVHVNQTQHQTIYLKAIPWLPNGIKDV